MEPTAQRLMFTSSGISGWEVINYLQTNAVADGTNIDFPVGYQAGDSVFAVFLSRASNASSTPSTPTLPSGYRNVQNTSFGGNDGSDRGRLTVYMLNEITTETSFPYTGDNGTANHIVLIILRKPADFDLTKMVVSNIDYAKSVDIDDPDEGDNTPTLPSITTDLDENFIFAIGLTTDTGGAVLSTPTNYTSLVRVSSGIAYNITYRNGVGIGTVNPADMTASISKTFADASVGSTIALRSRIYEYKTNFTNFTTKSVDIGGIVQESTQQTFNAETLDDTSSFAISISGGNSAEYQINGGSWTSSSGTITKGDTVNVRQTSVTGTSETTTASTCTLTINGLDYTYTLNTRRELVVSGSATITLSNGVNSIYVVGTGAGGNGGDDSSSIRGGGGGGGGAMSIIPSLSVSNGQSLVITAGQRVSTANGKGGNSFITISGTTVWRAVGGWGGQTANSTHAGVGGLGGTAEGSIGTIKFSGGNGGDGVVSSNTGAVIGGGGGGAGGYSANGGAGASGNTLPSNDATGGSANVTPSAAATGGAASGGASACGGGGTGVSGEGTSGAAATRGGNEGSPDIYASSGVAFVGTGSSFRDAGDGGNSGGGGGGSPDRGIGNGEDGRVRITW